MNHACRARDAEMKDRLARMGAEPAPTSPAEFTALIKAELAKYAAVVKFSEPGSLGCTAGARWRINFRLTPAR